MLDHYDKLMNAAAKVSPVLSKLENEHLSKFNLSWKLLNKWLFHTSIYTDSFFENSVPLFINQLGKLKESFETDPTVHSFLQFDDEVSVVEAQWKVVAQKLHKYCLERGGSVNCQKRHRNDWHGYHLLKLNLHKFCEKPELSGAPGHTTDFNNCLSSDQISANCECSVCLELGSCQTSHAFEIMDLLTPTLTEEGYNLFPHLHNSSVEAYEVVCTDGSSSRSSPSEETAQDCCESLSDSKKNPPSPTKNGCTSIRKLCLQRVDKATQKDQDAQSLNKEAVRSIKMKKKATTSGCTAPGHSGNEQPGVDIAPVSFCSHSCSHAKHSDKIKRVSCSDRFDSLEVSSKSDFPAESKLQSCDCCYCEVFGTGPPPGALRNYMESRERLRFILNKKRTNCKASNNVQVPRTPTAVPEKKGPAKGTTKEAGDTRNLDELLHFIEGNENKERNEKKAAKKARQKERKIQLIKQKEEEERAQEVYRKALAEAEQAKAASLEKNAKTSNNKKKNKNKNSTPSGPPGKDSDSAPKMLTIKRIMDSNSSEPTVTITLRGATPNQDRVLYTLLNGQVCEVKDSKKSQYTASNSTSQQSKPKSAEVKTAQKPVSEPPSNPPSQKKQKKKEIKVVEPSKPPPPPPEVPNPTKHNGLTNPTAIQINNAVNRMSKNDHNSFKIEDLKLPPGITITKVDPSTIKPKVPIKEKPPPQKPVAVPPPLSRPPSSSEVIVVATGNLKEQARQAKEPVTLNGSTQPTASSKKKKNKKNKNDSNTQVTPVNNNNNNSYNNYQKGATMNGHPEPLKERNNKQGNQVHVSAHSKNNHSKRDMNAKIVNTQNEEGKKKKKKSKSSSIYDINSEELRLLDSVFAPKDIDLENGDIDDAERELEAFKRFCLQSVPPKRKEKVHLNIKDIILRKKTSICNES